MKITALFALLCVCAVSYAAPPKPETFPQAIVQVDGMTSAIVDKLWENTDRYWHQGDYYRIVALIRIVGEADPGFGEAYANGAWLLWSLGDVQGAEDLVEHGLANAPADKRGDLQYEVGYMLFAYKKDYKAALPYLQKASDSPGASVLAFTNLAHCYERTGDLTKSAATWRKVVEKFPAFGAGPTNLRRVEAKIKGVNTKA